MRCWVLYGRGTLMLVLLLTGLGVTFAPTLYLIWYEKDKIIYLGNTYSGLLSGCVMIPPSEAWVASLFLFVVETMVFLLALRKTMQLNSQLGATPLVEHLLKDGSFFYAAILLVVLFTCIGGITHDLRMAVVFSGFYTAVSSVLCSHMIFSLHTFSRPNLSTIGSCTVPPGTFGIGGSTQMRTFRTQSRVVEEHGGDEDPEVRNESLR
ncbi:hypothetical protein FS749_007248 [Ceratobasidium sp. UAMH 11750]|nr:hypothetical protein FS749_007248 [Ceratobasidium sp. UAMH 11750]